MSAFHTLTRMVATCTAIKWSERPTINEQCRLSSTDAACRQRDSHRVGSTLVWLGRANRGAGCWRFRSRSVAARLSRGSGAAGRVVLPRCLRARRPRSTRLDARVGGAQRTGSGHQACARRSRGFSDIGTSVFSDGGNTQRVGTIEGRAGRLRISKVRCSSQRVVWIGRARTWPSRSNGGRDVWTADGDGYGFGLPKAAADWPVAGEPFVVGFEIGHCLRLG